MKLAQKTTLARYALSLSVVCGISLGINTNAFSDDRFTQATSMPTVGPSILTALVTRSTIEKMNSEELAAAKPEAQHYLAHYYAGNNPDIQGYETLQNLISLAHADAALSSQIQDSPNQPQLNDLDLITAIANLE